MRFWKQSALSLAIGAACVAPLVIANTMYHPKADSATSSEAVALYLVLGSFVVGFVVSAVALLRMWGKFFFHVILPRWPIWVTGSPPEMKSLIASNPLYRWVFWIDEYGENRDRHA
ncbi:hypothetical protein [Rhodobacter sp. SY28-1]|uniref:hypothetical protein n=1 Tax=Rhodobacter sp. SY28-1 TaxID=2562317 RepID=UPI0010C126DB|nr:hypothetical protein [Rhodobacter sp. SY28-1]